MVVHVHGFGEHHRRHDRVAAELAARSLAVVRFDLRGHGESEGPRGDFADYSLLLGDVDLLLTEVQRRFPNVPHLLFGHSFGGGIVVNWLLHRPHHGITAAVLSSPWLRLKNQPGAMQRMAARMAALVAPTLTVPTGIKAENLASDPDSMKQYRGDPLVVRRITLRAVLAAMDAGDLALNSAERIALPLLVMHGTGDRITSHAASESFAKSVPGGRLKLFENLAHEMHFEKQAGEVVGFAVDWIERQL